MYESADSHLLINIFPNINKDYFQIKMPYVLMKTLKDATISFGRKVGVRVADSTNVMLALAKSM